ncbi:MAG TPA: response regulator [Gemmataceae bacterium]|jgi:CheY-like chemotaxis protein|nr:response regulator [Gemmataceae bacterium]
MSSATPGGKTILVVEDDDTTRQALGSALREAGYAAVLVEDGRQALDWLWIHTAPDLVLLDMMLPVLDGWHFLQLLRQQGPTIATPIIIATAAVISRELVRSHGCAGLVQKPIETGELLQEIERVLTVPQSGT